MQRVAKILMLFLLKAVPTVSERTDWKVRLVRESVGKQA